MNISRKVAVIPTDLHGAIKMYLLLTQPLHKIKSRGIDVLSTIIYMYHKTDHTKKDKERWNEVFSYDGRIKIRKLVGDMSDASFNNHLSSLRGLGAIKENKVIEAFNPAIDPTADAFEVVLRFALKK